MRFVAGCWLIVLLTFSFQDAALPDDGKDLRPAFTLEIPSLERMYADFKFLFELVSDPKGYRDLRDTFDLALDGISIDRPCQIGVTVNRDRLEAVGSLPAKTNEDFRKFLQALDDADVRTSSSVPPALRSKFPSVKLQPNERVFVSMYEGFVRFEPGSIRLGHDLEAVRRPYEVGSIAGVDATATLRLSRDASTPERRRAAFENSREKFLSKLTKDEQETDAAFAFQKSLADGLLTVIELPFAESSEAAADWKTSHNMKQFRFEGALTPGSGTSLEHDLHRVGQQGSLFARVSRQNAVFSASWNSPLNAALIGPLKGVIEGARTLIGERVRETPDLSDSDKSDDREFVDFACDVLINMTQLPDGDGVVRVWSNENRTLTTVAAIRVADSAGFLARIRESKRWQEMHPTTGRQDVVYSKSIVRKWPREFAELFDREGAVFVGIEKGAVWFGIGENALLQLANSANTSQSGQPAPSDTAISLHAEMRPLSEVWNQIHSRRAKPVRSRTKATPKSKDREKKVMEEKPSLALFREIAAHLNLPQIAARAYQEGDDAIEFTLKRQEDRLVFAAVFNEGTLRFLGGALSKFVKDNF